MNYEEQANSREADIRAALAAELDKVPQQELIAEATIALVVPALAEELASLSAQTREALLRAGRKHIRDVVRLGLVQKHLEAPAYGVLDLIEHFAENPVWPPRE